MKLIRCDRHPDREATHTFRVTEVALGSRPFLMGYSAGGRNIDVCDECTENIKSITSGGDDVAGKKD